MAPTPLTTNSKPLSAGVLLRAARQAAQLSQTDLARRAGVAQSVISTYESDRRQPSLRTLTRLIEACGQQLVIDLRPLSDQQRGLPDTKVGRRLRHHRQAILDLARRRGMDNVRVFGSVARGDDTTASDIDLLVDIGDDAGLLELVGLGQDLSELLGTKVDVVPADSLKPQFRGEVFAEAVPL